MARDKDVRGGEGRSGVKVDFFNSIQDSVVSDTTINNLEMDGSGAV